MDFLTLKTSLTAKFAKHEVKNDYLGQFYEFIVGNGFFGILDGDTV